MTTARFLDDAYCVDTSGTPFASRRECGRLVSVQVFQLFFLAVCMRRVTSLAGTTLAPRVRLPVRARGLLYAQALLAAAATLASLALVVVAFSLHSTAALVISGAIDCVSWWFYFASVLLQSTRHDEPMIRLATAAVTELAFLELDLLPLWHNPTHDGRVHLIVMLLHARVALAWMIAFIALVDIATKPPATVYSADGAKLSPFDRASWFSRVSYNWISPLIVIGKQRRLENEDVPHLSRQDATSAAARRFINELEKELRLPAGSASFLRVLRRLYAREVLFFALWSTFNKLVGLASPLLIKLFLDWAAQEPKPDLSTGYKLAMAMVLRSLVASVSGTQYSLAWKRFDLRVRAGLIAAIYDRTMTVSSTAKQRVGGIGRISNLVSVDVGRLVGMPGTLFDMFLIPIEIIFSLALLAHEVKYAFVGGVIVLACMLPIQTLLGGKIQAVTKRMLAFRDKRVGITAEALKAIRTIKLLAWTDAFMGEIDTQRRLEMQQLSVRKYLDAFCVFFWASTPVIVQTSVFVIVVYSGNDLTAANAFTAVSLLERLIYPMNYFPWIINGFLEARVSALRVREFLFPEHPASDVFEPPALLPPMRTTEREDLARSGEKRNTVEAEHCVFTWNELPEEVTEDATTPLVQAGVTRFTLELRKLELKADGVYLVCGSVGAGKSSLLLALLGEMPRERGRLVVQRPRVAYAPQTPWLFTGTVRANITMAASDLDFDEALYKRVLRVCELEADLQPRKLYDMALVSENGSNFSGGQKIRINLARALYQQTKLYLLDDPLSGLDAKTARAVLRNCFSEQIFPDGSTVVLTTHAIQLVEEFPSKVEIIVMADGEIVEAGRFQDLKASLTNAATSTPSPFMNMLRAASLETPGASEDVASGSGASAQPQPAVGSSSSNYADESESEAVSEEKEEEHRESGSVHAGVWTRYAGAIGWPLAIAILLAVTVMQVSRNGLDWWIAFYTNSHSVSPQYFANMLLWITLVNCVSVFFRAFLFAFGGLQAARAMYADLIVKIFRASLQFFDATPVGRILNRLSGDTYSVDESLPFILNIFLKDFADVVGTLVIIFYGNKFVLLLLVPLSLIYFRLQASYRPLSRHVQRLESTTQSPILSMFTETLEGLSVIRAMKLQEQYCDAYEQRLNLSQRMSFLAANAGSWFGIRLDMLGVSVTSFVAVFAVVEFQLSGKVHPGVLGLTLTYALPVVGKLNTILGSFVDTERQMIAVERVKEYSDLAPEEQPTASSNTNLMALATWPSAGVVHVDNLVVTYSTSGSSRVMALKSVSCAFQAGEKIGICGRTGAGKSTFMHALFRAAKWEPGSIISIDGVAIDQVPLHFLRSRITYVPQEVVLFSGTVRWNLDPEGNARDDQELWEWLKCVGLYGVVAAMKGGLDFELLSGESTFSKGQAQLLCIARALLRQSKVLCIDEATSSMDYESERVITETLSRQFASSTVIIIAHRLKTIESCDRVFVFDNGSIVESGPPRELLGDKSSKFFALSSDEDGDTV